MAKSCCYVNEKRAKTCRRKDNKVFILPRRFTRKKCKKARGFTMRSSCAPFKYCHSKRKKRRRTEKVNEMDNLAYIIKISTLIICQLLSPVAMTLLEKNNVRYLLIADDANILKMDVIKIV